MLLDDNKFELFALKARCNYGTSVSICTKGCGGLHKYIIAFGNGENYFVKGVYLQMKIKI